MKVSLDVSWKSLNKHGEELCGDTVGILKNEDSDIFILSDGMGSGVKANILSTLTMKILGTMLRDGANIQDCVETIAKTLPVCTVRHVAYSTFTILQIFKDGHAYLVAVSYTHLDVYKRQTLNTWKREKIIQSFRKYI